MKAEYHSEDKIRYGLPDTVRGVLILGMIAYHTLFDIVLIYGYPLDSPLMRGVNVIRDVGAACFIFLSGFCFHFGRRNVKKGLLLFGAGLLVTAATYLFDPESCVLFGVLTFLGTGKLLLCAMHPLLERVPAAAGCAVSFMLFLLLFSCNYGYAGYGDFVLFRWPTFLYRDYITAFFGFPFSGFFSSDYFGLLPWFFVLLCGYFSFRIIMLRPTARQTMSLRLRGVSFIGRYSLFVYLIHQPVIYCVVWATKKWFL